MTNFLPAANQVTWYDAGTDTRIIVSQEKFDQLDAQFEQALAELEQRLASWIRPVQAQRELALDRRRRIG